MVQVRSTLAVSFDSQTCFTPLLRHEAAIVFTEEWYVLRSRWSESLPALSELWGYVAYGPWVTLSCPCRFTVCTHSLLFVIRLKQASVLTSGDPSSCSSRLSGTLVFRFLSLLILLDFLLHKPALLCLSSSKHMVQGVPPG